VVRLCRVAGHGGEGPVNGGRVDLPWAARRSSAQKTETPLLDRSTLGLNKTEMLKGMRKKSLVVVARAVEDGGITNLGSVFIYV
jgi:hypothetical protein